VELRIESIAAGGDGVGRSGGLVAFVPRTAPGDVVRARLTSAGRFARGTLDAVLTPSDARVTPPCPHYERDRCGGCQLQHLALAAQHEAKRRIVADALARIARRAVDVPPPVPSPAPWRYRRKLTLALRRVNDRWVAGLRAHDDPDAVFALEDCPITDPRVVSGWHAILAAADALPRDARELRGAVRLLAGDDAAPALAFTLEGGERWAEAGRLFDAVPALAALWWHPAGAHRRRLLHDRRLDAVPGASFVQVNPGVAARLADDVVATVLAHAPARVVDAYAGAGDVAVRLADAGVRVVAVELDEEAAAHAAARLPANSRAMAARVEDALDGALPADVVIVNPPRAGLAPEVPAALERAAAGPSPPRALVYVSCNPATLARDLARLPSYVPRRVQPYDMFPQTAHVETLVELVPATPPAPRDAGADA
jgi:tRNA/tmRNA/rRNA uracil-C5-methylase (TrmA/RlmC/RlmD family)